MRKQNSIIKTFCLFLIALCCFFAACTDPDVVKEKKDDSDDSNAGAVKELTFSHDSGLYSGQFSLEIKAPAGSSIYYTTDGSVPEPNKSGTAKYSSPITVKNRNGEANVLSANAEQFYMVPGDPRGNVPPVYTPTNAQVPKATVIRAIAVSSSGEKSGVATKTYFVGDNLAGYGNIRVVSLVSDPDNLVSQDRGIMVRGNPSNRWDSNPPYNFRMKGADWERPAYLEIFEGSNRSEAALSTGVGIRVRGGYSRGVGQKSFSVYFKEQYGIKNLKREGLIPKDTTLGTTGAVQADGKTPVTQYKGFMLRNGANDIEYTKFYDVFLQDLLSDRSFATQASVPCIVYLNGEYWGSYNFQERYSDNHTEYKYGVNKDNVISYDNGELDDGNPGEEALFNTMVGYANKDMSNSANYVEFCNLVDIDNFIDYWAAEIYIYNEDWPQNNYRIWRTRNKEPGKPYGDTKWRYEMFDTEFALGIYNSGRTTGQKGVDAFKKILDGEYNNHENNKLFKALLANPDFCKKFVNTMLDLYNVNFHPSNYLPKLDSYAAVYKPLMDGYFDRWGYPGTWTSAYQNKVDDAKNYLRDIRDAMVYNYLPTYFSSIGVSGNNLYNVTLSVTGDSNATIKINTVTPKLTGSWTGKYYSGIPLTVTARAPSSGYEFDGWTVTGGIAASPSAVTTTVSITGNAQITAKYKLKQAAGVPVTGVTLDPASKTLKTGDDFSITATVAPSNATYKTVYWSSSAPDVATVDNNGKVTALRNGSAIITASTVEGKTATCTVTVTAVVTSLNLDAATLKLIFGAQKKLTANITPSDAPNKQTTWVSSDPSVATVSNDGTVTAKSKIGTTTITVTTVDGSKTATCTVYVKQATILLDLAAELQGMPTGIIGGNGNWASNYAFDTMFASLPIDRGGTVGKDSNETNTYEDEYGNTVTVIADTQFSIIVENGVKKLQFIDYNGGCPGLHITDAGIDFREGDVIEIKGKLIKIHDKCNGVLVNLDTWDWKQLQGWWSNPGNFDKTFILTKEDVDGGPYNNDWTQDIKGNHPAGIRLRANIDEDHSWEKRYPGGAGKVIVEQIKIYGYRD